MFSASICCCDRVRDLVLRQELADAAVLAFGARAVVAEDVEHDRVVADAEAIQFVDHLAGLNVDVLDEAGEDFHQPPLERTLRLRDAVPRGHALGARRELGIGGNPAEFLLALEGALAQRIPAIVELAFVLVGPFLEDVVRPVPGAGRPVHEERLVGRVRAMLAHPRDRLVRQVFAQMVFLVVRRLDRVEVLDQPRLPLRGFAGQEAVEVVEADALSGRPERERPHRRGLGRGRVVPLAEGGGLVSVGAQDLRKRRRRPAESRRYSRPSPPRAPRWCRSRRADDCGRSATPRASASRSTWYGTRCS